MITGFENFTYELTDYEIDVIAPIIVKKLKEHTSKQNPIKNKQLEILVRSITETKTTPARIRKIIHLLRVDCFFLPSYLVASSKGYWLTQDDKEVRKFKLSLIQRINSYIDVYNSYVGDGELQKAKL